MYSKVKDFLVGSINNNSFFTLFLRLSGVLFIFLTTFLFTNLFDSDVVGRYDFVRSFFLVTGSIIMLSADQTILFLIGRNNNSKEAIVEVYKKILLICFLLYLANILFFLVLFKLDFFPINTITKSLIFKSNGVLFFYCIYLINIEIVRALEHTFISETFRNIVKYLPLMLGFLLVNPLIEPNRILDYFIFGFVIIAFFSSCILFLLLKRQKKLNPPDYNKDTYKFIINYSLPVTLSAVSLYLLSSIDIFLIKYYFGDKHVAYYSLAFKIVSFISVAINAVGLSVATAIAYNFKEKAIVDLKRTVHASAKLIFYFSLLFSVVVFFFSEAILTVFGVEYLVSRETLLLLTLGNFIASIAGNTYMYLLMTQKGKILGQLIFTAVIINILLNVYLIPRYGLNGAAISAVISMFFWNFVGAYYVYKKDNINILFQFK
jgi:O-antigen/teichoic acid export membrane protein